MAETSARSMREQLEARLTSLKLELETGERVLAELETKRANLRETLLRISGAIQVLEEELSKAGQVEPDPSPQTTDSAR